MSTAAENVSTLSLILGSTFSKLIVTSSLLGMFEYCLLCRKLDFWGYNLGSKIFSFELVKMEIIAFKIGCRIFKNRVSLF